MAFGGLPSKRQGRLGRPKGHRHPHAVAFFVFFAPTLTLHLHLLPSSPFPPSSFFSNSFSSLACSLSFSSLSFSSLACSLSSSSLAFSFSSSAYSISYSFSFPIPFLLLFTTSRETHTVSGFSEPPHGTRLDTRLPV